MHNTIAAARSVYLLIAVTADGNISKKEFASRTDCENAKNLALYGETTDEYEKREAKFRDELKKLHDHPGQNIIGKSSYSYSSKDGESIQNVHGQMILRNRFHVKTAECIRSETDQ